MLDRFKALVPFIGKEKNPQNESLQMQMIRKTMELCLSGGYHYGSETYGFEWFFADSTTGSEKFRSWVYASKYGSGKNYACHVNHIIDRGKLLDILDFSVLILGSSDQAFAFNAKRIVNDGSGNSVELRKDQWESILSAFMESTIDNQGTQSQFENDLFDQREDIAKGAVIVEWVRDMQNPQAAIVGFLKQL